MGWTFNPPPGRDKKPPKATKAQNKAALKAMHKNLNIPGMNMTMSEGRAAKRYKDIFFPSLLGDRFAGAKPGGHLMWDKKPGEPAFPKKKGKKK